jgi:hypothetical protein
VRPARRIATVAPAVLLFLAAVALCLTAAACGLGPGSATDDDAAGQARRLELARAEFARAAEALRAGDREAFDQALATDGVADAAAVRKSLAAVYDTLAPLPWRAFRFEVTPLEPTTGLYRVRGVGQLGAAGPSDRIAVVRYLQLGTVAERVVVRADATPEDLRRRYLMALHDPVVLQRPGLLVLGDRRAHTRAARVMAAAERARARLAALGVGTRPTVVVTIFGSANDVRDALAVDAATARLVFFSYPGLRVAVEDWVTYDVGVMGPWLRDVGVSMDDVLTHELAHAYSVRWFAGDDDPPALLVEGIAEAAEGPPAAYHLHDEVASGNQLWPLPESFAVADVWDGNDDDAVRLGYELGGSLVDYVVVRWGASRLRPFVEAVAAAEPSEAGMDEALGDALGVSWGKFYAGWRRHVLTGR